jgi:hypothetical protein
MLYGVETISMAVALVLVDSQSCARLAMWKERAVHETCD